MQITSLSMNLIMFTLFFFETQCENQILVGMPNITIEEEALYGPLFNPTIFPNSGDIPVLNRQIFRGTRVSILEHPYVASIRRSYAHFMPGVILTRNIVLTIAHPLEGVPNHRLGVVVGENYADRGTSSFTVVLVVVHEDFDPYTLNADLAMLRLYENIIFKIFVKPITGIWHSKKEVALDSNGFVTGWGRCDLMLCYIDITTTNGRRLISRNSCHLLCKIPPGIHTTNGVTDGHLLFDQGKELCLPRSNLFHPDEKLDPMLRTVSFPMNITNVYCDEYKHHDINLQAGMLCVGPAREATPGCPCMAVPGAPLVVDGWLLGLQSFGFGCGYNHDLPLIYTDVRYYNDWINHNVNVLSSIRTRNMSEIFQATKALILYQWLLLTRKYQPTSHNHTDLDVQPVALDRELAHLTGTVYDLRDFVDDGKYHKSKNNIYNLIRLNIQRAEQVAALTKGVKVPMSNVTQLKRQYVEVDDPEGNTTSPATSNKSK